MRDVAEEDRLRIVDARLAVLARWGWAMTAAFAVVFFAVRLTAEWAPFRPLALSLLGAALVSTLVVVGARRFLGSR